MQIRLYKKFINTKEDSKLKLVKLLKSFLYETLTLRECKEIIDHVYDYTKDPHTDYGYYYNVDIKDYIDFELPNNIKIKTTYSEFNFVSGETYNHYEYVKIMRKLGWKIKTLSEIRQEKLKELGI